MYTDLYIKDKNKSIFYNLLKIIKSVYVKMYIIYIIYLYTIIIFFCKY